MWTRCHSGGTRKVASMHSSLQDSCLPTHLSPAPSGPWALPCGALNTLLLVPRAPVLDLPYLTLGTSTHTCHSGHRLPLSLELVSETKAFSLGHSQAPIPALNAGCGAECEQVVGTQPRSQGLGSVSTAHCLSTGFHQTRGPPWG